MTAIGEKTTIGELGEFGLIDRLVARLGAARGDTLVGAGDDDAAVLRLFDGRLQLATIDTQVAGVHFDMGAVAPADLGRKVAAINLSDIAAMGGSPSHALAALSAPADLAVDWALDLFDGLVAELAQWGADLVGGNLARNDRVVLDLALLGEVGAEDLLLRSGARPGDVFLVTGDLGAAAAGLALGMAEAADPRGESERVAAERAEPERVAAGPDESERVAAERAEPERVAAGPDESERVAAGPGESGTGRRASARHQAAVLARHARPEPRLTVGRRLRRLGATAAIDLSDGLAGDVAHLCRRSGVGARIDAARLPVSDATRSVADALGRDPLAWAVGGGEDYELLFAAPADRTDALIEAIWRDTGVPVAVIGVVTEDLSRWLVLPDGARKALDGGWRHFG